MKKDFFITCVVAAMGLASYCNAQQSQESNINHSNYPDVGIVTRTSNNISNEFSAVAPCEPSMSENKIGSGDDVIGVYEKVELTRGTLDSNGDEISSFNRYVFVPTSLRSGNYDIKIGEKISSKLYQIYGCNLYIRFRYYAYLYRFDEGMLKWEYNSGTFYKYD